MSLAEPDFIERDPQKITSEIVAKYEELTGKKLYPAQIEHLFINTIAYRETIIRNGIQEAAKQNLVAFARAPMLDYLGDLVGVKRLLAQPAKTTLRFTVAAALSTNLVIPRGTRVQASLGVAVFATDEHATLDAGQLSLEVAATCTEKGALGNTWEAGQINILIDPIERSGITVVNIHTSTGGIAEEDDEHLRQRIKLAPESFSNAGSYQAYRFYAMKAHQNIVDVAVLSPTPGVVTLYPLLNTGLPDASMLTLVQASCSSGQVRPLTDCVQVFPPLAVSYTIDVHLVVYPWADLNHIRALTKTQIAAYINQCATKLGCDVVPSKIIASLHTEQLQAAGVYQVILNSPSLIKVAENAWAQGTLKEDIAITVLEIKDSHGH